MNKLLPFFGFWMEIGDLRYTSKDIGRAIAVVKIDVQNQSRLNLAFFSELGYGYGHIVEKAEPPTVVSAGMMPRRSNKGKGRLAAHRQLGCLDGSSRSQQCNIIC